MTLSDKHVIVTGGGTGVGKAIAIFSAHAGAKVTILGRREAPLKEVASEHKFIAYATCDVTDQDSVKRAFKQARDINGSISIVIANAGNAESVLFADMSTEQLQAMISVNLMGVFNVWKAGLKDMQQEGWGRLIAIASTAGLKGYPYVSGYVATKHAVIGLTRSLALELGKSSITANAICPGFVETPLLERSINNIMEKTGMDEKQARDSLKAGNPQKRFIQVDEIAQAVNWLCSDGARSVNGHTVSISGGEI